jgi:hypothetical protein
LNTVDTLSHSPVDHGSGTLRHSKRIVYKLEWALESGQGKETRREAPRASCEASEAIVHHTRREIRESELRGHRRDSPRDQRGHTRRETSEAMLNHTRLLLQGARSETIEAGGRVTARPARPHYTTQGARPVRVSCAAVRGHRRRVRESGEAIQDARPARVSCAAVRGHTRESPRDQRGHITPHKARAPRE